MRGLLGAQVVREMTHRVCIFFSGMRMLGCAGSGNELCRVEAVGRWFI